MLCLVCAKLDHGVLRGLLSFKRNRKLEADSYSNSVPEEIEEHMIGFDMLNRGPCLENSRGSNVTEVCPYLLLLLQQGPRFSKEVHLVPLGVQDF